MSGPSFILSPEELRAFTGYTQRTAQIKWLREHAIEPFIAGDGSVQVTRDLIEHVARVRSGVEAKTAMRNRPRPNFDAIR